MGLFDDKHEARALEEIAEALNYIANQWRIFNQHFFAALDFKLVQFKGDIPMAINGVQAGGSGVFQASLIPANAVPLQSGPSFSTTDTLVTLTQDPANPFNVTAAVDKSDTSASFPLTVSGVNGAGVSISHTFIIPVIAAPPPQAVDFDLNQLS